MTTNSNSYKIYLYNKEVNKRGDCLNKKRFFILILLFIIGLILAFIVSFIKAPKYTSKEDYITIGESKILYADLVENPSSY